MTERKFLYMVRQTQPMESYDDTTIAIYETKEQADKLARLLNKEYARGVFLNKEGDFEEENEKYNYEEIHYYDVKAIKLNEPFGMFGV